MESIRGDVIGAINRFVDDQKQVPGECTFTFVQFDGGDTYEVVQDCVPIKDAKPLTRETYVPRGNTPLLDAIGRGINNLGNSLALKPENERPNKIVFLVQTDGHENASQEFKKAQISEMVKKQSEVFKWQFVFLGANMDAISEGEGMGIPARGTMTYSATPEGTSNALRAASCNIMGYRNTGQSIAFSDHDRAESV
jgi:hypothetical protein